MRNGLLPIAGLLIGLALSGLIVQRTNAQETPAFEWAKHLVGSPSFDFAESISTDAAGNVYTTGFFSGTVDFDPGTGVFNLTSTGTDMFICKLDANGILVWAKAIGTGFNNPHSASIVVDALSNVYTTGVFNGSVDFDPGPSVFNLTASTADDVFISKLDMNGNFVWAKAIGNPIGGDVAQAIYVDPSGNIYTTGYFGNTGDFDPGPGIFNLTSNGQQDVFISKLDVNGNFVWAQRLGGTSNDYSWSLTTDAAGNVYTLGSFQLTVDFDPGSGVSTLASVGGFDIFISKLDTDGNFVWAKSIGNLGNTNGNEIAVDGSGNVYITGDFDLTLDFDPGPGTFNLSAGTGRDAFICKLDAAGVFVWAKSVVTSPGFSTGNSITIDGANKVITAGYFSGTADFDPGTGSYSLVASNSAFYLKLDENGNLVWATLVGPIGLIAGSSTSLSSVTSDSFGNIYGTGGFDGTGDFDGGPCTNNFTGGGDIFILKINPAPVVPPPTIASLTPSFGPIGTSVTITGTNFSTTPVNNVVQFFNNQTATVTASTATSITTTVPAGAITGKISVTVNCMTVQSATDFTVVAPAPPTITSFAPTTGPVGTAVTITGTNFSSTPANNIVIFGATAASVTAATATQLTVTVPTGATYARITVLNTTTGLLAYSSTNFTPTFTPNKGSITVCDFSPKVDFPAEPSPHSVAISDLDGDGKADLAVGNNTTLTVSIFRNTSTGVGNISYAAKIDLTLGAFPQSISIGDLDGDGKPDLAVANHQFLNNVVSVFRNTSTVGTISYAARVSFATAEDPSSVSIGDLDGDGKADLAVTNQLSNSVSIFRNTSTGVGNISYAAKVDFTTGTAPLSVSIGDLDGDLKADLAVANNSSTSVSIFRNTSAGAGNISYAAKVDFTTGTTPRFVSIGDLDGDGKNDLVVANTGSNTVSVFRNTSTGAGNIGYDAKVDFTTGTGTAPVSVSIGDLDGDGKADLAVANSASVSIASLSIFRNTSSGVGTISYAAKVDLITGINPRSVSIGDLDGDGMADLAVANGGSSSLSVIRNNPNFAGDPTLTSFTPAVGPIGTSVTITGTNFSPVPAENVVRFFNNRTATVIASTATSLTVTVPSGTTTGKISITTNCVTVISATDFTIGGSVLPIITSFTPSSGPIGTTVTITGTNFSPTPGNNTVRFNGTLAAVSASSSTSITTTVPAGATTGTITVTISGNTATSASNFTVTTSPVITITTQPSSATVCDNAIASFSTAATGTTNITFQWQYSIDGIIPFTDVSNGGGYSNAATSTLSVNTTAMFGAGQYRCRINGDLAAEVITNDEGLLITPLPTAPGTTGNSGCSSTSIVLTATGASPGEYRWYSVVSGGTAAAGAVNDTYSTPVLTTTTTYYAAVNNGTCESTRTAATATVISLPASPTVTAGLGCSPSATIQLNASGGSAGQYRWYTTATGGSAIAAETSATYTTPLLTSTATFHVSINNGTCESLRAAVVAEIRSCAPTIAPASLTSPIGGQTTLDITPLVTTISDPIDIASIKVTQQPISGAFAIVAAGVLEIDYSGVSFAGTDILKIEACDLAAHCTEEEITIEVVGTIGIYNALSPNGDGKNEIFLLEYIDALPDTKQNKVTIFSRWGEVVFTVDNYDNQARSFRGLNNNGIELSTGTYYYRIDFGSGSPSKTGVLSLRR